MHLSNAKNHTQEKSTILVNVCGENDNAVKAYQGYTVADHEKGGTAQSAQSERQSQPSVV